MSSQINDTPEGFKITELGPLPEEWELTKLGEVCSITTGKKDVNQGNPLGKYPFFSCAQRVSRSDTYSFDCEAILIAGNGDVGSVKYYEGKFEAYQRTYVLHDFLQHAKYLSFYLYGNIKKELVLRKSGSTMPYVRKGDLTNFVLPLPPLPEQKAIARVLSIIQRAVEAQDKITAAARELKKSLMHHLFTYGPVSVAEAERVLLKETEIGPVPEHWEVVRLGEVVAKAKQVDPRREPKWAFKYVDVSGVSREQLKIIDFTEYIGENAPHRARKLVEKGDIIFATVRPYLKRVAVVPNELDGNMVSTAFCIIRCNQNLAQPNYIFQSVTKDDFVQRVSEHQRGSSYPAVTDKDILNQVILLPSHTEQQEMARMLSAGDGKIEAEQNRKTALQALFKTILHQLMTGKVRVKEMEAQVS